MRILLTITLILSLGVFYAQKIKEKKGHIFVDNNELLFVEKIKLAGNVKVNIGN